MPERKRFSTTTGNSRLCSDVRTVVFPAIIRLDRAMMILQAFQTRLAICPIQLIKSITIFKAVSRNFIIFYKNIVWVTIPAIKPNA